MRADFDYKEVPQDYIHCLNGQCPQSSDCLRFKIAAVASKEVPYFSTMNPVYVDEQKECPYFHPDLLIRYASGITRLYDDLTHIKYVKIKKAIHNYLGHSRYYRIYNKLLFIKPEEQDFIRELFIKENVGAEPLFDEYVERYDFFPARK